MNFNLVAAFKAFFATLFAKIIADGEAALKLAENDANIVLAKAKLAAFSEANKIKTAVVNDLNKAAAIEHTVADGVKADLAALLAKL